MFLREKKVKNNLYLYAVENSWKKNKGVKQKVKKYLGRIYKFRESKKKSFEDFLNEVIGVELYDYLDGHNDEDIIMCLVRWELHKKGFKDDDGGIMVRKKLIADLNKRRKILDSGGRGFAVKSNDGYLNNFSINQLVNYRLREGNEWQGDIDKRKVGIVLAKMFVECRIKVPHEVFVTVFEKKFLEG